MTQPVDQDKRLAADKSDGLSVPSAETPPQAIPHDQPTAASDALARWLKPNPTALPKAPNSDVAGAVRLGLWLLTVGFGGFLLWATLAPLDEGVPAQGVLTVGSKRKSIEHLAGGLIEKIVVREGQHVDAGDELVMLNEVQGKAALNATLSQWRSAAATVARLKAERDGARQIHFPPELAKEGNEPDVGAILKAQRDLLVSRRLALDGELRIIRESARGLESQLASLDQLKAGREKQIQLFTNQLSNFQKLNRQGFVSQNQLLDIERQLAEIQSKQGEDLANIGAVNARLVEFRMKDQQRVFEFRREVETQLADAQKEESGQTERLTSLRDSFQRLAIRAPVAGTVVDVAISTVGGVVKPGERIMDIVPDGDDLVVEAQLPPQYIDRVHGKLPADVHFDAYVSLTNRPVLAGEVEVVSADVMTDPRSGLQHYNLRVRITAAEMKKNSNLKLYPGMQCTVMIKTGERSFMSYLLRPLLRRFTTALIEH
jgi:protease secretion system membrane fusion protein